MIRRVILFWLLGTMLALADMQRYPVNCLVLTTYPLVTGSAFRTQMATYGYDPVGDLAETMYPSGLRHDYSFNAENRLVEVSLTNGSGSEIQTYSYGLSPTGMRTNVIESVGASIVRQILYGYDSPNPLHPKPRVNRLTSEEYYNYENVWQGYINYGYDAAGNRTNRLEDIWEFTPVDALTNQAFAFDHRDLIDSDNVPNNANPNYDANGNTLVDNGANTGDLYDAENRLISTGSGVNISYDVDGNRVSKTKWGQTTYYLVDDLNPTGYAQVLAEYSSLSSGPNVTYAWGLGLISQKAYDNNVIYYGYDGQGNVRLLLDYTSSSSVLDSYDYDGYGNLLASSGTDQNNYRYTGQQWDPDLGQYYLRARYYKPSIGRFWTGDTFQGDQEDPLSLHKYLYVADNPVNLWDPSGHDGELATLDVVETGEFAMQGSENLITSIAFQEAERSIVYKIGATAIVGALVTANVVLPAAFVVSEVNLQSQRTKLKTKIQNEEEQNGGKFLFHYTDAVAASQIASYQQIIASPKYRSLPSGAYATDIPPWSTEYTQGELSGLFYGGDTHQNMSAFVAIKQNDFYSLNIPQYLHQWVRQAPAGTPVPVTVVGYGPNLMNR